MADDEVTVSITIIIGTPAAIGAYLAGEAILAVAIGAIVAIAVGVALVLGAGFAWIFSIYRAIRDRDWPWLRDIVLAPLFGLAVAVAAAFPLERWMTSQGQDFLNRNFNGPNPAVWKELLMLLFGLSFFYLLIALPFSLRKKSRRWLAYPGFAFYCTYFAALGVAAHNHCPNHSC